MLVFKQFAACPVLSSRLPFLAELLLPESETFPELHNCNYFIMLERRCFLQSFLMFVLCFKGSGWNPEGGARRNDSV